MSDAPADLKRAVRVWLDNHLGVEPVPARTEGSRKVHLSVWRTRAKGRPIGVEFGHDSVVNIWLAAMNVPRTVPPTVTVVRKIWAGSRWTDAEDDGANSNLKGYDGFKGANVVRLGVTRIDDALAILEAVAS